MTSCRIKFNTNTALLSAIKVLYKNGFVFTVNRYRGDAANYYPTESKTWKYIFVGHTHYECKMIFNTSAMADDWNTKKEVSFYQFIKEVLPTW